MGKSDLLKDSMKTGLDGLLSPTGKTPQPQRPAAPVAEKEPAVHCIFVIDRSIHTRMKYLSIEKEVSLKEIVNEANQKAAEIKARAEENIERDKQRAVNDIKDEISDIVIMAASKVVEKEISAKDNEAIIADFLQNVGTAK